MRIRDKWTDRGLSSHFQISNPPFLARLVDCRCLNEHLISILHTQRSFNFTMARKYLVQITALIPVLLVSYLSRSIENTGIHHHVRALTLPVLPKSPKSERRRIPSSQPLQVATTSFVPNSKSRQLLYSTTEDKSDVITSELPLKQQQPLNPAVHTIQPSKTVAIFSLVKQMEATQGIKVTSLCVGEPDFSPPTSVTQSMMTFLSTSPTTINQATKYTAVSGLLSLRQAIAKDLQIRKNIVYDPSTEILISNGAKQSVYQAIWAMAGTGDVVLIPSPYWPSYPEEVRLTGATPIVLPTTMENGYRLSPSVLEQALQEYSQNAKVLILCNPCNPTGTVYSEQELLELCQVLQQYPNITVIADEIYERLVYTDGPPHVSIASLPNMFHRTITINGFSKSHAMTGLRIGYSCAPAYITTAMTTLQSQLTSCANAISQYAAIAALEETPDAWMSDVIETMQQKRDYVMERLRNLPFVSISNEYPPTGAFYVLPDVRRYCRPIQKDPNAVKDVLDGDTDTSILYDDVSFCLQLLEGEQLAIVPGTSFGLPGTVRLSYATSMEELEVALNKFENFLTQLRNERPQDFLDSA